MESVVRLMDEHMPCEVVANASELKGEGLVYTFNTTFYNGARREARMKVHIYALNMARGLALEKRLDELLVKRGEQRLTATTVSCVRNGGGWLIDGDWHIRIAYYDFVFRVPRGQ